MSNEPPMDPKAVAICQEIEEWKQQTGSDCIVGIKYSEDRYHISIHLNPEDKTAFSLRFMDYLTGNE